MHIFLNTQSTVVGPNDDPSATFPGEFGCGGWRKCPAPYTCVKTDVGRSAYVGGYDNLLTSMLTTFQVITLSDWTFVMYRAVDATGWYTVIYFVPLVLMGSMFMLNLFLAVLKSKFGQAQALYKQAIAADATILERGRQKSFVKTLMNSMHKRVQSAVETSKIRAATKRMALHNPNLQESEVVSLVSTAKDGKETPWYLLPPPPNANAWVHFRFKVAKVRCLHIHTGPPILPRITA